jgi:hypothetical protein
VNSLASWRGGPKGRRGHLVSKARGLRSRHTALGGLAIARHDEKYPASRRSNGRASKIEYRFHHSA